MQEHLIVLRAEIARVEYGLNKALEEENQVRQRMDDYVTEMHIEVDKTVRELNILRSEHAAREANVIEQEKKLSIAAEELADKQARFNVLTKETEDKIADIVKVSRDSVKDLNDRFSVLSKALEVIDLETEDCKEILKQLDSDIAVAKDDLMVHREFVRGAKFETANLNAEIEILLKQKSAIQEDVENEAGRIAALYAAIEERESAQDKRESNYKILKGRLGKVLNTIYPDQNIDNLI